MPWNGSGVFSRLYNWVNDAAASMPILPDKFDAQEQDIVVSGLGNCITRDGQGGPTADIPWNNFGITGLRTPMVAGDAVNKSYVDVATSARSMGGYNLTNVADPVNPQDAATKAYVGATTTQLPFQPGGNVPYTLVTRNAAAAFTGPQNVRIARTSNTMLAVMDSGQFFDITSGTFTQTFDTAANLLNGWHVRIRNSGNGNITIPASDGLTNWVMYPGEDRDFYCDGTALFSAVNKGFSMSITAAGANNFITPPGYRRFAGIAWSGGASGQGFTSSGTSLYGGSGGGAFPFDIAASKFGASITITVGAGGIGNVTPSFTGSPGGDTTIGTLLTVKGALAASGAAAGQVNYATYVSPSIQGFEGGVANTGVNTVWGGASSGTTVTGSSVYGGASGAAISGAGVPVAPGTSTLGGNGGAAHSIGTPGDPGIQPGGGGAAAIGAASGNGAPGQVDIYGIA